MFAQHAIGLTGRAIPMAPGMIAPRISGDEIGTGMTCAVGLFDRRTGMVHRVNGRPLVVMTRRPEQVAQDLLIGRDATVWEVRVEPLTGARR